MGIYGIDVSAYQAEHFPTTVQGHPVSFAFVKATEGTSYINPRQSGQTAWARQHGMVLGFYHFLHSGNVKAQAAYFVEKCLSVAGDILACDWEMAGVSNADKDAFLKEVKRLRPDHKVILYVDRNHWLNVDKTSFCQDGLWLANYNGSPSNAVISHPFLIHQYTSTPVDTNYAPAWATKAAMKQWATGSTKPPAKTTTTHEDDDMPSAAEVAKAVWSYKIENPARPDSHGKPTETPALSFQRSEDAHYTAVQKHLDDLEAKVDKLIAALGK